MYNLHSIMNVRSKVHNAIHTLEMMLLDNLTTELSSKYSSGFNLNFLKQPTTKNFYKNRTKNRERFSLLQKKHKQVIANATATQAMLQNRYSRQIPQLREKSQAYFQSLKQSVGQGGHRTRKNRRV